MELHDIKIERSKVEEAPSVMRPSISFKSDQLPELKGKKVGDKVRLIIIGDITGISTSEHEEGERKTRYEIEIIKAGLSGSQQPDEDEEGRPVKKAVKEAQEELEEGEE